jgi:hypothetical protein
MGIEPGQETGPVPLERILVMAPYIAPAASASTGTFRFFAVTAAAVLRTISATQVQAALYAIAEQGVAGALGSLAALFASRWRHKLAAR